uniref:Uncharacterized protein n=1 Tax=Lactuca sativa TaxID=4236 RepID=A0A9R1XJG4_LACSA|nr:hypothetical protein LSAT_V11C300130390 [Lactuca sativa]
MENKLSSLIKIYDVVSWSTMIIAFTYSGLPHVAIGSQHKLNAFTMLNLVESCLYGFDLKLPKSGHGWWRQFDGGCRVEWGYFLFYYY